MKLITLPVERIIDLSLQVGMIPDAKFHYRFEEYSKWQMDALIECGMKPQHKLLDIGCGPLRLGIQAINYLDDSNYCGMDAYPPFIDLGKLFFTETGLKKKYQVILDQEFNFRKFNETFDFAIAQSVFTHLSKEQIETCMRNLKAVMKKGGTLLFTNIQTDYPRGFLYGGIHPMISGAFCNPDYYRAIAKDLQIEFVEKTVKHPTQIAHLFRF
ncbi:MAG: class I SAM-dependent methyltransferase [Bacteroidetes bacterium]|nr:class I SAM-dependent methyltransferase [Bacteroidota bacterium]